MLQLFAERIYGKAITAREIINNSPESRILGFLNTYKKEIAQNNSVCRFLTPARILLILQD